MRPLRYEAACRVLSVKREVQLRAVHAVVRPVGGDECLADVLQGGLAGVLDLAFGQDDPNPISALGRADPTAWTQAELRLLDHLDLGH